ncbi:MAG: PRC-barrel domain-containing protein [Candidatus Berkelbacteria bacterium]|nr:PRC-barrel domain-containing protein [Candidatus Berkelbacteria bacterium]
MRFTENIVGMKVMSNKKELIGTISDLVISIQSKYPIVHAVAIKFKEIQYIDKTLLIEPAKNIKLIVPWEEINFKDKRLYLKSDEADLQAQYLTDDEILVGKNVIDSIITNAKGNSIGRVNDAVIFERNGKFELFGLGVGIIGIVAKLGLEIPLEVIDKGFGRSFAETVIDWKYVKKYHPNKNEIVLSVGEELKAEKTINWSESKKIDQKQEPKTPIILIPWVQIEKIFKKRK